MRSQPLAAFLVCLLMICLVPTPATGHATSHRYDLPSGASGNEGTALSTRLCAEEWDDWDDGLFYNDDEDDALGPVLTTAFTTTCSAVRATWAEDGIKVGVYPPSVEADDHDAGTLAFEAVDDHFDSTYIRVEEVSAMHDGPWESVAGCGTVTLDIPEWSYPQVWVYATFVDPDDLEVCLGSSGTVEIDHVA